MDTKNINTTALAYIGDAVYEVYIREYVMKNGAVHADRLHREAVRYVSAAGQAKAIRKMFDSLDEEEQTRQKSKKPQIFIKGQKCKSYGIQMGYSLRGSYRQDSP